MGAELAVVEREIADADDGAREAAKSSDAPRPQVRKRSGGFAGFSWGQLVLGALLIGFAMWNFWMMRQVDEIRDRRIVAVSLSGMINEFIAAEARSGNGPDQVNADTQRFMAVMQQVLSARAKKGETVIVGEAVVAGSAPDITLAVKQEVGKRMLGGRKLPAMPAVIPQMGGAAAPATAGE